MKTRDEIAYDVLLALIEGRAQNLIAKLANNNFKASAVILARFSYDVAEAFREEQQIRFQKAIGVKPKEADEK